MPEPKKSPSWRVPSCINLPSQQGRKKRRKTSLRKVKPIADSLTESVRRVLLRVATCPQPFGVFVINGRLVISGASGARFESLSRRWPDGIVGTYDRNVHVMDLVDDLYVHFPDRSIHV